MPAVVPAAWAEWVEWEVCTNPSPSPRERGGPQASDALDSSLFDTEVELCPGTSGPRRMGVGRFPFFCPGRQADCRARAPATRCAFLFLHPRLCLSELLVGCDGALVHCSHAKRGPIVQLRLPLPIRSHMPQSIREGSGGRDYDLSAAAGIRPRPGMSIPTAGRSRHVPGTALDSGAGAFVAAPSVTLLSWRCQPR